MINSKLARVLESVLPNPIGVGVGINELFVGAGLGSKDEMPMVKKIVEELFMKKMAKSPANNTPSAYTVKL
jgi:hypothetical protein